jgi:hypothetical protein
MEAHPAAPLTLSASRLAPACVGRQRRRPAALFYPSGRARSIGYAARYRARNDSFASVLYDPPPPYCGLVSTETNALNFGSPTFLWVIGR